MNIEIDASKILTAIILAGMMYIGQTVYTLDQDMALVKYQVEQLSPVLQDLHENK